MSAATPLYILGIESSCDDTAAAVLADDRVRSNVIATQGVHERYGGVVPELASRAHQQNIVPVVAAALQQAGIKKEELDAVAVTIGPGLLGSLLVGVSFAKGLALSLGIPLLPVNHLQGHIMALFLRDDTTTTPPPPFPFLCLLVSGGNTQIVLVKAYNDMQVLGQTIDDAAGEAMDKCSKVMGLGYPGGPIIDRLARKGDSHAFSFGVPHLSTLDFSFSGLKTSFLYTMRKHVADDPLFIEKNKEDIAASIERTIVEMLMKQLIRAAEETGITHVALAGGVAANTALRTAFRTAEQERGWTIYLPPRAYTTDNAAMIARAAYAHLRSSSSPSTLSAAAIAQPPFSKVTFA